MTIVAKIGERLYEFAETKQVSNARSLYAQSTGNQNDFESQMTAAGIGFVRIDFLS